jgi:alpha-amylase
MKKINFLMGLHCHQPADNFKSIFEEAYRTSYEPFLSVLERHPKIKLSLHYSGSTLDWILEKRPEFLKRIKRLTRAGQVELITGGYFEPILPMIPPNDAKGQIEMLTSAIKKHFDFKPGGIWLAERVWDPSLSSIFKDLSDIKYAILDDFHLEKAGVDKSRVFGHYSVSEPPRFGDGGFSVFASIKRLRYTIPFRDPQVTIDFLKGLCGKPGVNSVTFGDDCEKFGLWPHTYDWVYKKGWLEKFFLKLEENDWIRTLTFSEALKETGSLGAIDIPHSSYAEMSQWCGGDFNNFFRKYPESDLMRKRMLSVSERIKSLGLEGAKTELYKSQSNCAYWHGIFGGIYTNHLRRGIYSHIINAEEIINGASQAGEVEKVQFQEDSPKNIVCARNKHLALFIDPDYAGSVFEIDYKPLSFNLLGTMSRRWEPYHEKLTKKRRVNVKSLGRKTDEDVSIDLYEVLGVRERNLKKFLNYDSYRKSSMLCHFMRLNTSLSDFIKSRHATLGEEGFFGRHGHEIKNENGKLIINLHKKGRVKLDKRIILEKDAEVFIKFDLENTSFRRLKFLFGVEFNWSIEDKLFLRNRSKKGLRKVELVDKFSKLGIEHTFEKPMNLWSFPVYTLNESERGIGKNFQGISLLFYRKLALGKDEKFSMGARIKISAK